MEEALKTSQRAYTVRECLGWKHCEAPWSEYYNSNPFPHGWERHLKQARGPAQWDFILVRSPMKWILQLHPLPPWMGEVLKRSQRACTVRECLGWKHREAPWSDYYNSNPSPHGWERHLKQARGPAQWDFILVRSPMKHHTVNIATPPTTLPPLPGWNASPSRHCLPVCCHLTQNSRPVCVCCGGGGGGWGT